MVLLATPAVAGARSDQACFRTASVSGYQVVDDTHVVIEAPTRTRTYLLTFYQRCNDIAWSNAAALSSFGTRACSGDFAKVITRGHAGRTPEVCRIKTVERVASLDEAKSLVAARTKP
jgi:hypothetical protein